MVRTSQDGLTEMTSWPAWATGRMDITVMDPIQLIMEVTDNGGDEPFRQNLSTILTVKLMIMNNFSALYTGELCPVQNPGFTDNMVRIKGLKTCLEIHYLFNLIAS